MAPKSCQKRGLMQGSLLISVQKEGRELFLGLKNSGKGCTVEMSLATHRSGQPSRETEDLVAIVGRFEWTFC